MVDINGDSIIEDGEYRLTKGLQEMGIAPAIGKNDNETICDPLADP